jgi:ribosome-binding factor A
MNVSTRQKKVSKLLQKELGDILQQDKRNILGNAFVTVTEVDISPDLSIAKVYLSMILVQDKEELIQHINDRKREIRGVLGRAIGKQLRIVPDLIFTIDDLQEKATKLDQIIDELEIPPSSEDEEEREGNNKL